MVFYDKRKSLFPMNQKIIENAYPELDCKSFLPSQIYFPFFKISFKSEKKPRDLNESVCFHKI